MTRRVFAAVVGLLLLSGTASYAHTRHHARSGHHVSLPGIGRVCTSDGRCARVVSWATSAFQGAILEFESLGYAVGSPGCLSPGHMRHSKHHWGGACDLFNQVARNRTALRQPPPPVQIAVAERHGLISGCMWKHPDCGHVETPSHRVVKAQNPRSRVYSSRLP